MSKNRVTCPDCGAKSTELQMKLNGCSSCNLFEKMGEEEESFREFMALESLERWRLLWKAAGKPEAY